jgi:Fe-S cluster biogenesis protein NfuA
MAVARRAAAALRILVESTPNPRAVKFSFSRSDDALRWERVGRAALASESFVRRDEIGTSRRRGGRTERLASALFAMPTVGSEERELVASVFAGPDFVTVESSAGGGFGGVEVDAIRDEISQFIDRNNDEDDEDDVMVSEAVRGEASDEEEEEEEEGEENRDAEVVRAVLELLDEKVRPHVQADGGDVEFDRFEDGIVYLSLVGACASCPSSTVTVRFMIQNLLTHMVPEVTGVREVKSKVVVDEATGF